VITVGSVHMHGTTGRIDDTVNNFSSRGPTRGATVDTAGVRHVDNLLKPDLVAPGNKIISAGSTSLGSVLSWNYLAANNPSLLDLLGNQIAGQTMMSLSGTSVAAG